MAPKELATRLIAVGGVAREDDLLGARRIEEAAHGLARVLEAGGGGVGEDSAGRDGRWRIPSCRRDRWRRAPSAASAPRRRCRDRRAACRRPRGTGSGSRCGWSRRRRRRSPVMSVSFVIAVMSRPSPLPQRLRPIAAPTAAPAGAWPAAASASRTRLVLDLVDGLADEALDQQRARLVRRNAARAHVEQQVLVELGRGRAVAADHVVGVDLELGLGIELGVRRQHEHLRHLLAVGLLRVGAHDHLALEHAARPVGEHALEQLAALAAGHRVIDDQRGVDVLGAAAEEQRRRCRAWRPRP